MAVVAPPPEFLRFFSHQERGLRRRTKPRVRELSRFAPSVEGGRRGGEGEGGLA